MIKEKLLKKEIYKEKQEKKINIIIRTFLIIIVFMLVTGCSNNINKTEEFKDKMEENKFVVADLSDSKKDMVLAVGNHYQISFYNYKDKSTAKKILNKEIKKYKDINTIEKNNCSMYFKDEKDIYSIYILDNSSYISIIAPNSYKKEIDELLKSTGYYCQG